MSKKHELELVSRLGFGLEEHMGVHVICEEDETTEADLCHRVLWGEAMSLLAQRDKLLAALKELLHASGVDQLAAAQMSAHAAIHAVEVSEVKGGV